MNDSDHHEILNNTRTFPGPKLFLLSGYEHEEIDTFSGFIKSLGYADVPVKYCTVEQLNVSLESVLSGTPTGEPAGKGKLPNVMVFSGMTSTDVQLVMRHFKESGLPRPIFATTTPTNMSFTVKALLRHLLEEQKAAIGVTPSGSQL